MTQLIIVSGWPASGKSTLAKALVARLRWDLLAKDEIKEALFDTLGQGDREWSRCLSEAAYGVMFRLAHTRLAAGLSLILEANFEAERHGDRLATLIAGTQCRALELHCHTDPALLLERAQARATDGTRHPGHRDGALLSELERVYRGSEQHALGIAHALIEVATGPQAYATEEVVEQIVQALSSSAC